MNIIKNIDNIKKVIFKIEKHEYSEEPEISNIEININDWNKKNVESFLSKIVNIYKKEQTPNTYFGYNPYDANTKYIEFEYIENNEKIRFILYIYSNEILHDKIKLPIPLEFKEAKEEFDSGIKSFCIKDEDIKKLIADFINTIIELAKVTPYSTCETDSNRFIIDIYLKENNIMIIYYLRSQQKIMIIGYEENYFDLEVKKDEVIIYIKQKHISIKLNENSTYEEVSEKIKRILN